MGHIRGSGDSHGLQGTVLAARPIYQSRSVDLRIEMIGAATLYLGDCREILPTLGKIDAVVADPPYGINNAGLLGGESGRKRGKWNRLNHANAIIHEDDKPFDPSFLLDLNVPTVLWGANFYSDKLPRAGWLVWDKKLQNVDFISSDAELAFVSTLKNMVKMERYLWMGLCRAGEIGEHLHPSQKPIAVMQRCIELCGPAETILDPFMGSGTTGVAAIKLGRKFIGIEIEPKYFDIARRRIDEASRQKDLFVDAAKSSAQSSPDVGC